MEKEMHIDEICELLFRKTKSQALIPFLGAGVSDSEKNIFLDCNRELQSKKLAIDIEKLSNNILAILGLEKKANLFMIWALNTALIISELEKEKKSIEEKTLNESEEIDKYHPTTNELVKMLVGKGYSIHEEIGENEKYPPSSSELIEIFENYVGWSLKFDSRKMSNIFISAQDKQEIYDLIKYAIKLWGLPNFSTSLSAVAEQFELIYGRRHLKEILCYIFQNRIETTKTHNLIAEVASHHLKNSDSEDYLIITTNYDCLMEKALDIKKIPYAVMTWNFYDEKIYLQFSENVENIEKLKKYNTPRYPIDFFLQKDNSDKPFVIIYKIHGSLDDANKENDSIVITQNDYYTFISKMSLHHGIIPGWVCKKIGKTPILFLGYSLRDWNIREILRKYRSVLRSIKDIMVVLDLSSKFERQFYEQRNIVVIESDLPSFTDIIYNRIPKF